MEQLYRLNKTGSAMSHVEQGSSCLSCGEDPGDADVPKKCVSHRQDQRGDGSYPPALPGPVPSVSMLEVVTGGRCWNLQHYHPDLQRGEALATRICGR